jgi:hypothetical protein
VQKLIKRAESGDARTLPVIREMLKDPRWVEKWGNLAKHAERAFVNKAACKDLGVREGLLRKLELLRAELAGPSPTPLEQLLVARVVSCWLQVHDADVRYARDWPNMSLAQAKFYEHRMDRTHKRYLSAIKTLALVRKLVLPVLQVNIAEKQVNVAGP